MGLFDFLFSSSSESDFALLLIQRLTDAGETKEIQFDEKAFQLHILDEGEEAGVVNLSNLYAEYSQLPQEEHEDFFSRITKALLSYQKEIPDEYEDAKHDIRPIVRSRSYFEMLLLEQRYRKEEPLDLPYVEIGDNLLAAPVFDLPESLRTLDSVSLEEWNLSLYEAMEIAVSNLEEVECVLTSIEDHVYLYSTGDSYDASRLLLTDRFAELELEGSPVAMLPNRDMLLITGSEDEKGLELMLTFAEAALNEPRPISGVALRYKNEHWENWLPEPEHPMYARFKLMWYQSMGGEYQEQKAMLESVFKEQEIDLFAASFSLISKEESLQLASYSVWSRGLKTLLPQSDYVFFYDAESGTACVASASWNKVKSVVGDLMTDLDTFPPRYQVEEFPTEDQLQQLGVDPDFILEGDGST